MRRKIIPVLIFMLAATIAAGAQEEEKPFAEVDRRLSKKGWFVSQEPELIAAFNRERRRLGNRFEPELLKYLDDGDPDKHYWISFYVADEDFLQGNAPLPLLSLLIKQQGLALLEGNRDEDGLSSVVALNATAAVLSEQLNFHALARFYKAKAEAFAVENNDAYTGGFPAITEAERKIYDRIAPLTTAADHRPLL